MGFISLPSFGESDGLTGDWFEGVDGFKRLSESPDRLRALSESIIEEPICD